MPRVGILVECGRDGLEAVVCPRICVLLQEASGVEIEPLIVPMDNKKRLIEECGTVTRNLFVAGCDRVVLLWDEHPAWPNKNEPPCRRHVCERVKAELQQAGVGECAVYLVCVGRTFETWLLHDHHLLSALLSTDSHPVPARKLKQRNPERVDDPKGRMISVFKQHGRTYVDLVVARRIATALNSLDRLKRCDSFSRFAEKVSGVRIR
jgi:hypothetical protein